MVFLMFGILTPVLTRNVQVIRQGKRLKHRLDPRFPCIQRPGEIHLFTVKDHRTTGTLFHPGDLPHEGRFTCAIVTHDGHVLALLENKIRVLQSMHAAIMFGQAFGFQNGV